MEDLSIPEAKDLLQSQAGLTRINLNSAQKDSLSQLSGTAVYLRNVMQENQLEISQLQDLAKQNAFIYLQRQQLGQKLNIFEENNLYVTLVEIQQKLGLKKVPRRIECYDISHLSGKFVYGSMVVFKDGRPSSKDYRLFKTKEQNDDFANHKEVLTRRIKKYFEYQEKIDFKFNGGISSENNSDQDLSIRDMSSQDMSILDGRYEPVANGKVNPWELPDLIIVDGGKGQLSSDEMVLAEFNLLGKIEICSLAKKEEEVFLPNQNDPVLLEGQARFMVQRIRDEAHRFAITSNRNARLKTASKSQLDDISGIGPVTKQKLLATFGSVTEIATAIDKNPELIHELVGASVFSKLKKFFGV
jgi:excinuclease ABC subunit C